MERMADPPGTFRRIDPEAEVARLAAARQQPPQQPPEHPEYTKGYRDGESNREADIRIAVTHSRTWEELLGRLRAITGDPDLEFGSEWGWHGTGSA